MLLLLLLILILLLFLLLLLFPCLLLVAGSASALKMISPSSRQNTSDLQLLHSLLCYANSSHASIIHADVYT